MKASFFSFVFSIFGFVCDFAEISIEFFLLSLSVFKKNIVFMPYRVGDKLCGVQILIPHPYGGDSGVPIGAVVVNSVVYIDAGGVLSALIFATDAHRALAHFNGA